ncbi:hypothetical protein PUNSTDRAFT_144158 [Punctularia strigosozonata HHB-11173 SS5]|uniref:uncharacterized protein n=1 Tax=Punctularia strigosozonata (strain HHB-11173) TaxID=741275 RepID=UPI0004417E99|nr:uncharacterized protein PUNSTDRAFT_144158 [Punctularia strigosozonata HHB-11173 SS5]EIN08658.1 hypothetical protein PUNSTDRAFT_144158 [Punctularia strigosozonata HHB-11173 SS5]
MVFSRSSLFFTTIAIGSALAAPITPNSADASTITSNGLALTASTSTSVLPTTVFTDAATTTTEEGSYTIQTSPASPDESYERSSAPPKSTSGPIPAAFEDMTVVGMGGMSTTDAIAAAPRPTNPAQLFKVASHPNSDNDDTTLLPSLAFEQPSAAPTMTSAFDDSSVSTIGTMSTSDVTFTSAPTTFSRDIIPAEFEGSSVLSIGTMSTTYTSFEWAPEATLAPSIFEQLSVTSLGGMSTTD